MFLLKINNPIFLDIILDYNVNKFKYENFCLTIPFNKEIKQKNSILLNHFIKYSDNIINQKNKKIYKIEPKHLSIIKYKNEESFEVEYLHEILCDFGESYSKVIADYTFNKTPEYHHGKSKILKKNLKYTELPRR